MRNESLSSLMSNTPISLRFLRYNSNERHINLKDKVHISDNLPCDEGPYIWDKSMHQDGIGSTFHWRKWSLIVHGIVKGKWIGNLFNGHELKLNGRSYYEISENEKKVIEDTNKYFGLSYKECNADSLMKFEAQNYTSHQFFYTSKEKCVGDKIFKECLDELQLTSKTIVVFDWKQKEHNYHLSAFNSLFR